MADLFQWTAADGTVINLNDRAAGYVLTADGMAGLRSVPYEVNATQYAGMDGEQVQSVRAAASNPTLGLHVSAADEVAFRRKARDLVRRMRPTAGPGLLTVTTGWGEARSLSCYCVDGLPGEESPRSMNPRRWWRLAIRLYAPDPWWFGEEKIVNAGLGEAVPFFTPTDGFPLTLSSSTVQGQFTVDLSATDADSWPVWTIQGPGSGLVLTNETTGLSLSLDVTLGTGETMIIDTRPRMESVRAGDGTNLLDTLTPGTDPSLWPLQPAVNVVTAALTGATSESRIIGSYRPMYAGI